MKKNLQRSRSTRKSVMVTAHDHTPQLKRLRRVRGQIDGIERMIQDRRYCPEIVMQIKAARSALRSLQSIITEGHMRHCVKQAIASGEPVVVQSKIEEILELLNG